MKFNNKDGRYYIPSHPDYIMRMQVFNKVERLVIEDVAITKIEKVFAVISTIKRLVLNYINLNNKGGVNNVK